MQLGIHQAKFFVDRRLHDLDQFTKFLFGKFLFQQDANRARGQFHRAFARDRHHFVGVFFQIGFDFLGNILPFIRRDAGLQRHVGALHHLLRRLVGQHGGEPFDGGPLQLKNLHHQFIFGRRRLRRHRAHASQHGQQRQSQQYFLQHANSCFQLNSKRQLVLTG